MTITKLRQDLFRLADRALAGEPVEFTYKGVLIRMVAEPKASKLKRLVGQKVVEPDTDLAEASQNLLKEMEAEWEQDWAGI